MLQEKFVLLLHSNYILLLKIIVYSLEKGVSTQHKERERKENHAHNERVQRMEETKRKIQIWK